MQVLSSVHLDNSKNQLCDTPEATFNSKGTYKLCSPIAHEKLHKSNSGWYKNEISSVMDWYDFMSFSDGQEEFYSVLKYITGTNSNTAADLEKLSGLQVVHSAQLAEALMSKANKLRKATGM